MISLLRNKRGLEMQLRTAFEMAVAAMVLIMLFKNLYGLGSSAVIQERTLADDVGLLMDALQTVRPDVNLVTDYNFPAKFGIAIESKKVTVFEKKPDDGQIFWFTEDPDYKFTYNTFPSKDQSQVLTFFKTGNSVGVAQNIQPNLVLPYCKTGAKKVRADFESQAIASIGKDAVEIFSGDARVFAAIETGTPVVKVFVNSNPESAELACNIVQGLFKSIPNLEGFAIIPLNAELMHKDDPRLAVVSTSGLAAFVQLSLPSVDSGVQASVGQGISGGVKAFVV